MGEIGIAITGEMDRMGELYAAHAPGAARLAYLLTGDRQLAEDLVQEAFVRLIGRYRDLRKPDSFDAYLRTTVVNLSRKQFRRRRVERAYLDRERQIPRPESTTSDLDDREATWRLLLSLPPRQRAAMVLRYYEDLSERDVAEVMNVSPAAVKSLVQRGTAALRRQMGESP